MPELLSRSRRVRPGSVIIRLIAIHDFKICVLNIVEVAKVLDTFKNYTLTSRIFTDIKLSVEKH